MEDFSKESDPTPELTEFGPITPDDKSQGYGSYFAQFFKRKKKAEPQAASKNLEKDELDTDQGAGRMNESSEEILEQSSSSNSLKTLINDLKSTSEGRLATLSGIEEVSHQRTLPNVLARIKNILDQKGTVPRPYKDSDFKEYWLPDHLSKECYDCSDRFTPLRRRHHCRVCGQIFCSKCCSKMIPGKVLGYKGEVRVCTYCCKVVLTYLQSNNFEEDVLADLKALQEELLPPEPAQAADTEGVSSGAHCQWQSNPYFKRKKMFGFMEENYTVRSRNFSSDFPTCVDEKQMEQISSERQLLLKDSQQLHSLWSLMVAGPKKLLLSTNRHRLKSFPDSFIGRDFVQWLLDNDKASSRQSAIAIGQALLEAGFLFCVSQADQIFVDEHVLYNTLKAKDFEGQPSVAESLSVSQDMGQEPLWLKSIPSQVDDGNKGSPSGKLSPKGTNNFVNLSASSSNYSLDLNVKDSKVSMKNPIKKTQGDSTHDAFGFDQGDNLQTSVSAVLNDSVLSCASEQHSTVTVMAEEVLEAMKTLEPKLAEARAAGWQHQNKMAETEEPVEQLDEQTRMSLVVQKKFNHIWTSHENHLLMQLLQSHYLDLSWAKIIIPLVYKVVDTVRPDVKNEADDMDIRQYVQFKKVPGGKRSECRIINGTVCTKNVVHSQMKTQLSDPQILLLSSHIDYHRSDRENRTLSIDNVLLQEEEYIKKVVAKIVSYKPDIVITGDGISYLAREALMHQGLTLIMNVKAAVIERIARCTQAQVIPSVDKDLEADLSNDGEMSERTLGMCHSFYLRQYVVPSSPSPKTLMFFDGCATHLGCTVILRGAPNRELKRLKRVMYFVIFALYNWKLERSFLMDEFASIPAFGEARKPKKQTSFEEGKKREDPSFEEKKEGKEDPSFEERREEGKKEEPSLEEGKEEKGEPSFEEGKEEKKEEPSFKEGKEKEEPSFEEGKEKEEPSFEEGKEKKEEPSFEEGKEKEEPSFEEGKREETSFEEKSAGDLDSSSPNRLAEESSRLSYPLHSTPTKPEAVADYSDPLQSYIRNDSFPLHPPSEGRKESLADPPHSFHACLKNTLLSISPCIKYDIPYLESREGCRSPLRKYFPEKLYFSVLFQPRKRKKRRVAARDPVHPLQGPRGNVVLKAPHSFATMKITKGASDLAMRTALADFRARGGTIQTVCHCQKEKAEKENATLPEGEAEEFEDDFDFEEGKKHYRSLLLTPEGKVDALHPFNHQRISLLFFSFSHTFQYTSVFCVNPRVLAMDFYGQNDIPLGAFLERYCFSPSYRCLSDACQTSSLRHVRKFVHEKGCVEILLRKMDSFLDDSNATAIYMWSWCKKCREVSPVVPMSMDTWLFSFAKYLEFRFHDKAISRRGTPGCCHSIHQDHFHYFGQKDLVAVIKYISIPTRELVIPPAQIQYVLSPAPKSLIVDMIKAVAVQGYNLFSTLVDRLSTISTEIGYRWDPLLKAVASHHDQQRLIFRENIESIQLQLTSPSLERRWLDPSSPESNQELASVTYGILDQITLIKRLIMQVVNDWNSKVQDLVNLRKKDEKERLRTNSGNFAKHSSGSQLLVANSSTGSVEQLDVSSKAVEDSAGASVPQTASSDPSSETTPEAERPQPALQEQRKSTSSIGSQGNISVQSVTQAVSEDESGGTVSGHQCLVSLAQSLMEGRNRTLKTLDALSHVSSPPISSPPFNLSPAQVAASLSMTGSGAYFSNSGTEKDVGGGIQAVMGARGDEHTRGRKVSNPYDVMGTSFRPGFHQFISPSKSFHERSLSDDGEVVLAKEALERVPEKRYSSSVKNIISTLWSSSADLMVKSPFDLSEHYTVLPEVKIPVVIYDEEPSSIIAKALSSQDYDTQLQMLQKRINDSSQGAESKLAESQSGSVPTAASSSSSSHEGPQAVPKASEGEKLHQKDLHIDMQWSDQHANYYCKILFVEQFRKLRQLVFPYGEEFFIRSLSRCVIWDAKGGKSGSFFCKTTDDRFILKEMSRFEINSFLEFAPAYIQYMTNCKKESHPTALTRIVGVYRIGFKNSTTNKAMKLDLLVMENLFYQRCIGPKFDLKGSVRNRKVNLTGKEESEVVLLDENLLQMACSSPFYLRPHSKSVLTRAVAADSAFLAQQLIMDYSLLVGVDEANNQLVVGIIDYIRTFTWDKKLETIFKGSVLGAGTGKLPTVISPELYRNRFCHAMESYFVVAPDRWSGLGLSFDS